MHNKDFGGFCDEILEFFERSKGDYVSPRAIQNEFNAYDKISKEVLDSALKNLIKKEKLVYINGKYSLIGRAGLVKGVVRRNERGFGFLCLEDEFLKNQKDLKSAHTKIGLEKNENGVCSDLFLPPDVLKGVYNGDRILARRLPEDFGKGDAAEPICVLSRGTKFLTGSCKVGKGFLYVVPDDLAFGSDLRIIGGAKSGGIKNGTEVYCEIVSYPQNAKPQAKIVKILGDGRNYKVREECILMTAGVPEKFSAGAIGQADNFGDEPSEYDLKGRTDFTDLTTFTIDGDDSRDFDDAVSVRKTKYGEKEVYELFVHIADVSHYVAKGSALDNDALSRGTSIYLPDRVIPMIPEKLSNGLCSLNEGTKRLALTAKLCYDKSGNLIEKSFYKSIIASNRRLTYKKVQAFFDGDKNVINDLKDLAEDLKTARELKNLLGEKRKEKGFVDFETGETHVFYENGELIVESRERLESEILIEEFMIAANVAVAEYLYYLEFPCIYRVHEKPSPEKINGLAELLKSMGVKCLWKGEKVFPSQIQNTLNAINDDEKREIASNASLRAMQKAYYSTECGGHFGLNEQFYCHFTSPIRRYPDLSVHRALKDVLDGKTENIAFYREFFDKASRISSETEKNAEKIERAVDDVYICKFMSQFIGDYFEGAISGVNSFGFFVRLENAVEGLVRLEELPRGDYVFDKTTLTLSNKKLKFSLGKRVIVKLVSADISSGKIGFKFEALCK